MSAPTKPAKDHGNFLLNHPAFSATVITIIVTGIFLGALAKEATGSHGGSAHGAASGAHGAGSGAPAASAAPGTPSSAGAANPQHAPH